MTSPTWDANDDRLMDELKAAVSEAGQVPADVVAAARAAFIWRTVDEELEFLTLTFDSAEETALVRGAFGSGSRMLAFEAQGLNVEVEITGEHLVGQLLPPQLGHVRVSTPDGNVVDAAADEAGCFLLARPPAGPLRLGCETAQARFVTEWMPI